MEHLQELVSAGEVSELDAVNMIKLLATTCLKSVRVEVIPLSEEALIFSETSELQMYETKIAHKLH